MKILFLSWIFCLYKAEYPILINNNIFQQRFYDNPEIEAIDILLQERMPEDMIITKEKKVKPVKVKYKDYESYNEEIITNIETIDEYNVISNENYSIITNEII